MRTAVIPVIVEAVATGGVRTVVRPMDCTPQAPLLMIDSRSVRVIEWEQMERTVLDGGAGVYINLHLHDCGPFVSGQRVRITVEPLEESDQEKKK